MATTNINDRITEVARSAQVADATPHHLAMESKYQRGVADAATHDQDSLALDLMLREENVSRARARARIASISADSTDGLVVQQDIIRDSEAQVEKLEDQLRVAETNLEVTKKDAAEALEAAADIADIKVKTTPGEPGSDEFATKKPKAHIRNMVLLYLLFFAVEAVANYLAFAFLRDDDWVLALFAISVAVGMIAAAFFLAQRISWWGKAFLLVPLLAVVFGTGMMRYQYVIDTYDKKVDAVLPNYMNFPILVLGIGIPLMFVAITWVKTHLDKSSVVFGIGRLRQRVVDLEARIGELKSQLVVARSDARNGRMRLNKLLVDGEAAIEAAAAYEVEQLAEYFRGMQHGAGDPVSTARLDRRFVALEPNLTEQLQADVEAAIAALRKRMVSMEPRLENGCESDQSEEVTGVGRAAEVEEAFTSQAAA